MFLFLHRPSAFERHVMSQLDDINSHVSELSASLADTSAKVDTLVAQNDVLISLADSLSAKLAGLGEAGQIPPAALSDLLAQIDNAKSLAQAVGSKADAEVAKVEAAITADTPVDPAPATDASAA